MTELFIYYRAQAARADELRAAVLAMQDRLRQQHPHLIARLLRRPDAVDGLHTWMETYAIDPRAGTAEPPRQAIEAAAAAALAGTIVGSRHVEVFTACAC